MEGFNDDPVKMFLTDAEISDPKEEEEFFESPEWLYRQSLDEVSLAAERAIIEAGEHIKKGEDQQELATNKIWQAKRLVAMLKLQEELEKRYEARKDS